jgi:plastocyanin
MTAWRLIALAAFLVLGSDVRADDMVIQIENFTFNPAELTIKPGTTVTWKNADDIPHSVVEDGTKFRSKPLDTGETFSMTFTDAGEIGYFCGLHPHMKGKIIVKP